MSKTDVNKNKKPSLEATTGTKKMAKGKKPFGSLNKLKISSLGVFASSSPR